MFATAARKRVNRSAPASEKGGVENDHFRRLRLLGPPTPRALETAADAERMVRALAYRGAMRRVFRSGAPARLLRLWWVGGDNEDGAGVLAARRAHLSRGAAPALHPATDLEWVLATDDVRALGYWLSADSALSRRARRFPHCGDWVAAPAPPMPGDQSVLFDAEAARFRRYGATPYRLARQLLLLAAAAGAPRVCAFVQRAAQRALPPSSLRWGPFAQHGAAARAAWAAAEDAALAAACEAGRAVPALVQASPRMSKRVASGDAFDLPLFFENEENEEQEEDEAMNRAAAPLSYTLAMQRFRPELWSWLNRASGGKFVAEAIAIAADNGQFGVAFAAALLPGEVSAAETRERLDWLSFTCFGGVRQFDFSMWIQLFARAVCTSNLGALQWLCEPDVLRARLPAPTYAPFAYESTLIVALEAAGRAVSVDNLLRSKQRDRTLVPQSPWEHAVAVLQNLWDSGGGAAEDDDGEEAAAAAALRLLTSRGKGKEAAAPFWAARRVVHWMRERAPPALRAWLGATPTTEGVFILRSCGSLRLAVPKPALLRALAATASGGEWRPAPGAGLLTVTVRWARSSAHLVAMLRAMRAVGVDFALDVQRRGRDAVVHGLEYVGLCPWTAATWNARLDVTALQALADAGVLLPTSREEGRLLMMRVLKRSDDLAVLDWMVVALARACPACAYHDDDDDSAAAAARCLAWTNTMALDAMRSAAAGAQSIAVLEWIWRRFAPGVPLSEVPLELALTATAPSSLEIAIERLRWLLKHGAHLSGSVTATAGGGEYIVIGGANAAASCGEYVVLQLLRHGRVWRTALDRAVCALLKSGLLPLSSENAASVLPSVLKAGCVLAATALWAMMMGTATEDQREAVACKLQCHAAKSWPLSSLRLMFGPTKTTAATLSDADSGWRARLPWTPALFRMWLNDSALCNKWALEMLLRRGSKRQQEQAVTILRCGGGHTSLAENAALAKLAAATECK